MNTHKTDLLTFQTLSGIGVHSAHQSLDNTVFEKPQEMGIALTAARTRKELAHIVSLLDRHWASDVDPDVARARAARESALKVIPQGNDQPSVTRYWEKNDLAMHSGAILRDLLASGVHVAAGTDDPQPYLFAHGQVWNKTLTGQLSNAEALRIFTLNGARALRVNKNLGSIEAGKLAEFVVLNSNPLDDIANTADILYMVIGGEVYDPKTLNVLWPTPRMFDVFPWANTQRSPSQ
jgi:imidazolonepropionase-like amidohydrolase